MRRVDYYLLVSVILFVVDIAITPVGGFHESNPYHKYYISGFLITAVNTLISLLVVYLINTQERAKKN